MSKPVKPVITNEELEFISFEDAGNSPDGMVYCNRDHWWICHPEKGVVFYKPKRVEKNAYRYGQRFREKETAEYILGHLFHNLGLEVRQIPLVFWRVSAKDIR